MNQEPPTFTPLVVLSRGLVYVGFGVGRQKGRKELLERQFRAHYGVGSRAIAALIADLQRLQPHLTFQLQFLFMAIYWMKQYDTEEVMASRWGYAERFCREVVRAYVSRIQALKPTKITFNGLSPSCRFLPVDTVHIQCQEFRCDPHSKWYSHKFNGPGVSFEVVADPIDGKIRWINGPQPASMHDLTFLRGGTKQDKKENWKRSALYFHVPDNTKLVGDSAYEGQADKVSITKDAHNRATKALFARMKSMMETCFGRLKSFRILRETFRHGTGTADKLNKVKMVFEAAAVLVQYDCENGHPLFEP
jgi:hypothetical protein